MTDPFLLSVLHQQELMLSMLECTYLDPTDNPEEDTRDKLKLKLIHVHHNA